MENGTFEQIVSHLEKELEVNGLEPPDEMQIDIVTQKATKPNPEKPKPTCETEPPKPVSSTQGREKPNGHQKDSAGNNKIVTLTVVKHTLTPTTTKTPVMALPIMQTTEMTENQRLSTHPLKPVVKRTTPKTNGAIKRHPRNRRPLEQNQNQQRGTQINTTESVRAAAQTLK